MTLRKSASAKTTIAIGGAALVTVVAFAAGLGSPAKELRASSDTNSPSSGSDGLVKPVTRAPLDTYVKSIRPYMFSAPGPPAAPAPAVVKTKPVVLAPPTPEPPPDPLADFVYTGAVTIDGKRYALLENKKTR